MNDSIFAKMMKSLQEKKAEETKANLQALKESRETTKVVTEEIVKEEVEIEVAEEEIEAPINEVETVEEVPAEEEIVETVEKSVEEGTEEVIEESVSQDSQIKTTNKGTEVEELDGIKPATGDDGIPEGAVKETKLEDCEPDIAIKTGGRLIEITEEPECEEACEAPVEEVAEVEEPIEEVEELEVIEEPVEEIVEDEEFLDESTFNPFLTKFIRDNYSNAKAVVVEKARMNGDALKLECKILFNSGKTTNFELALEGVIREGKISTLKASDNGFFKAESIKKPFAFRVSYEENIIKCEGLSYNFTTKLAEGKVKEIKGKLIKG